MAQLHHSSPAPDDHPAAGRIDLREIDIDRKDVSAPLETPALKGVCRVNCLGIDLEAGEVDLAALSGKDLNRLYHAFRLINEVEQLLPQMELMALVKKAEEDPWAADTPKDSSMRVDYFTKDARFLRSLFEEGKLAEVLNQEEGLNALLSAVLVMPGQAPAAFKLAGELIERDLSLRCLPAVLPFIASGRRTLDSCAGLLREFSSVPCCIYQVLARTTARTLDLFGLGRAEAEILPAAASLKYECVWRLCGGCPDPFGEVVEGKADQWAFTDASAYLSGCIKAGLFPAGLACNENLAHMLRAVVQFPGYSQEAHALALQFLDKGYSLQSLPEVLPFFARGHSLDRFEELLKKYSFAPWAVRAAAPGPSLSCFELGAAGTAARQPGVCSQDEVMWLLCSISCRDDLAMIDALVHGKVQFPRIDGVIHDVQWYQRNDWRKIIQEIAASYALCAGAGREAEIVPERYRELLSAPEPAKLLFPSLTEGLRGNDGGHTSIRQYLKTLEVLKAVPELAALLKLVALPEVTGRYVRKFFMGPVVVDVNKPGAILPPLDREIKILVGFLKDFPGYALDFTKEATPQLFDDDFSPRDISRNPPERDLLNAYRQVMINQDNPPEILTKRNTWRIATDDRFESRRLASVGDLTSYVEEIKSYLREEGAAAPCSQDRLAEDIVRYLARSYQNWYAHCSEAVSLVKRLRRAETAAREIGRPPPWRFSTATVRIRPGIAYALAPGERRELGVLLEDCTNTVSMISRSGGRTRLLDELRGEICSALERSAAAQEAYNLRAAAPIKAFAGEIRSVSSFEQLAMLGLKSPKLIKKLERPFRQATIAAGLKDAQLRLAIETFERLDSAEPECAYLPTYLEFIRGIISPGLAARIGAPAPKSLEKLFSCPMLDNELRRIRGNTGRGGDLPPREIPMKFRPTRGPIAELSAFVSNTCWSGLENIMASHEGLVFDSFELEPEYLPPHAVQTPFAGGALLTPAETDGNMVSGAGRIMVVHALNPHSGVMPYLDAADLVEQFLDHVERNMSRSGARCIALPFPADKADALKNGCPLSNRAAVIEHILETYQAEAVAVRLAPQDALRFNEHDISGSCRIIHRKKR